MRLILTPFPLGNRSLRYANQRRYLFLRKAVAKSIPPKQLTPVFSHRPASDARSPFSQTRAERTVRKEWARSTLARRAGTATQSPHNANSMPREFGIWMPSGGPRKPLLRTARSRPASLQSQHPKFSLSQTFFASHPHLSSGPADISMTHVFERTGLSRNPASPCAPNCPPPS